MHVLFGIEVLDVFRSDVHGMHLYVCMYVCMYVRVYTHNPKHTCMHVLFGIQVLDVFRSDVHGMHLYVCMYVCMYVSMYVCKCVHIYTKPKQTHTCMCFLKSRFLVSFEVTYMGCISIYVCMYACIHAQTCKKQKKHNTHIHTHTHMHESIDSYQEQIGFAI